MILLILLAILAVAAVVATVHEVHVDGYGRVRTDRSRLPHRD
jgi:hypothetical protein